MSRRQPVMSLRQLRHDEFLLERRLGYQTVVLFGLGYVFDPRGFWLLMMAIGAGRLIWLHWSATRNQQAAAPGDDDPEFVRWDIERRLSGARRSQRYSLGMAALFITIGLVGRIAADTQFWVTPFVLSVMFAASAVRGRDVAALLARVTTPPLEPGPAHHDAK